MIFDAFNESLDSQRVFGLLGKPFPWKTNQTRLVEKRKTKEDVPQILKAGCEKSLEWASYICGLIFDKEDSPFQNAHLLDEEYVAHLKEDRLTRMLAGEVNETEHRWIVYDDEQTEVTHLIRPIRNDNIYE